MESQLICGNCFDELPRLPARSIDMLFCDPPYNIGVNYGHGPAADRLEPGEYLRTMSTLIDLCIERLAPGGSIWFLIPEAWADEIGKRLSHALPRRNRIIWRETFGQYREDRFASGHRHLFWHVNACEVETPFYTEEIRVPSQRMLAGDKRAAGPRVPDDVWEIPRLVGNAGERIHGHPCQLPEKLLERIILCSTDNRSVVCDPMAGTGTTLAVARKLGRNYIGVEQQPKFQAIIRKRLAAPLQQTFF